jgi:ABC-type ATPase involved in cell division
VSDAPGSREIVVELRDVRRHYVMGDQVARALVNQPLVLLADEPTGNLDSKTAKEILDLFDELHEQGRTIILVTHDPLVASRAEWVLRVLDGKVHQVERGGRVARLVMPMEPGA